MSNIPLDSFTDSQFAFPATYVNKSGMAKDIMLIEFNTEFSMSQIGQTEFLNYKPTAICKSSDIADVSKGATLTVHDYAADEDGNLLLDESGDKIIAEAVMGNFNITENHKDAVGFTELLLSLN